MNGSAIRVDSLRFELALGFGLSAPAIQDRIGAFCRTHFSLLLQRAVQASFPNGTQIPMNPLLERLDLEVGDLPVGTLESTLSARLEAALMSALGQQGHADIDITGGRPEAVTPSALAQAVDFLSRGALPRGQDADDVMSAALEMHPAATLLALRRWGRKAETRQRLARSLKQNVVERVIRLCAPTEADGIITYTHDLERLHRDRPLVADSEAGFRATLWEVVLAYLLADRGSRFNTRSFVARTLQQIAVRYRIDYRTLLAEMAHTVRLLRLPPSSSYNLPQLLLGLYQDHVASASSETIDTENEIEHGLRSLQVFLEHGVIPLGTDGLPQNLTGLIEALLEQAPDQLRVRLEVCGRSEVARRRIAQQVPQTLFERIVCLLEPGDGPRIQADLAHLCQVQALTGLLSMAVTQFRTLVAELTLYALVERVARFNRHAFLSTLLQRLATRRGFAYPALLRVLMNDSDSHPVSARWYDTLCALNDAVAVGVQTEAGTEALDSLLAWLAQGEGARSSDIASQLRPWLIDLARREPEKLRRLLHAAGRDGRLASRLASLCDTTLAQRLLVLLAPGTHAAWNDCLGLIRIAYDHVKTSAIPTGGQSLPQSSTLAALEATFWEAAFEFLLSEPNGAGMSEAYRKVGIALMHRHSMSDDTLRAFIAPALRDADINTANGKLLNALTNAGAGTQQLELRQRQEPGSAERQQLLDWLEFGIEPKFGTDLGQWLRGFDDRTLVWALQLCAPHARMLERVCRRLSLGERAVRLLRAVYGISAGELDEVRAVLKLLDPRPPREMINRLLLAAMLSGTARDARALLHGLLQALAPSFGRSLQALLRQLHESRKVTRLPSPLRHALLALEQDITMDDLALGYRSAGDTHDDGAMIAPPTVDHIAVLLHYLREGKLPHWDSSVAHGLLRRWMAQDDLWRMDEAALDDLRAIVAEPSALRRLQQHLSRAQLLRLVAALTPDFGGFVASWLMAADDLARDRRIVRAAIRIIVARHVQATLIQLSQSKHPSSAAALLRALGESAATACAIAPALYWECLHAAAVRRARQDARFLPLIQTIHSAGLVRTADATLFIDGLAVEEGQASVSMAKTRRDRAELDPIATLRRYLRFGESTRTQLDAAVRQASSIRREELTRILRAASGRDLERARIVHGFPAAALQQSLRLLLGQYHAVAVACMAALQTAMGVLAGERGSARWGDACIDELLRSLHTGAEPIAALQSFIAAVARGFRRATGISAPDLRTHALQALQRMRAQTALADARRLLAALPDPAPANDSSIRSESEQDIVDVDQRATPTSSSVKERTPSDNGSIGKTKENLAPDIPPGVRLVVDNAGLVLLWPFLDRYFSTVGLLNERAFAGPVQRMHAIHLTQFLVCGTQDASESKLFLNKILCGHSSALPLDPPRPLSEPERDTGEQLLLAVIQHWSKLGNTTIEGLRETFLMREGLMSLRDSGWHLQVQRGPFDVLMTFLPWSISTIRLPWMEKPLWVEWI